MLATEKWQALFAAIDAKDTVSFLSFLTQDAEFRFGSAPPVAGHAAVGAAVSQFFGAIATSRHEILHIWQDEYGATCQGEVTYTRHDARRVTLPFVNVFRFDGERIRQYLIYIEISPLFAPA